MRESLRNVDGADDRVGETINKYIAQNFKLKVQKNEKTFIINLVFDQINVL